MERGARIGLFLIFGILFISCVSAVTCSPTSLSSTFVQGSPVSLSIYCSNPNNSSSVTISKTGNFFNISDSIIGLLSSKTLTININDIPYGTYSGSIDFSDNYSIPILIIVQQPPQSPQSSCLIDIFPTIMNNVKVQQGETKVRNIQVNVPSCYNSPVNLNGIILATDERPIQLGEMNLGQIQPGNSINIPIEINAVDVSVGTYQDTLSILAYNSSGNKINLPSVSVSVLVSAGINPISNFSLNQLPSCSLSANILNLNNTYSLTCTKNNPNIMINPIIDGNYITGLTVDDGSTQYVYNFRAKSVGTTNISARFTYANAEIGERFLQEIKITNSGTIGVGGTTLDFVFYQKGISVPINSLKSMETIINVVDNSTRNLLTSANVYLNGIQLANLTPSFELGKSYELRATSFGYVDKIVNFNVSASQLTIKLEPSKSEYYVGEAITISSNIGNVSYLLDNSIITSPYTFVSPGEFILEAVKDGYISGKMNVTIKNQVTYTAVNPSVDKWKRGSKVSLTLTEDSIWNVSFSEEYKESGNKLYKPSVEIKSGIGNNVEFEIKGNGYYEIKSKKSVDSQDSIIINQLITNKDFDIQSFWDDYWIGIIIFLGALVIVGLVLLFKNKKEKPRTRIPLGTSEDPSAMESEADYG